MAGLFYGSGLLIIVSSLISAVLAKPAWLSPDELKSEAVKLGLQVAVVGIIGSGVKLMLDLESKRRAFRADLLERVGRALQSSLSEGEGDHCAESSASGGVARPVAYGFCYAARRARGFS